MRNYWNKLAFAAVALLATGFAACSEEEEANEWNSNYVYLKPTYLGHETASFTLGHNGSGITGKIPETTFNVALYEPSNQDVTVELTVESSENLPADKVQLSSVTATIPAGQTMSDLITVSIPDWSFQAENRTKTEYKSAVKIASAQGKVLISQRSQIAFKVLKNAFVNLASGTPEGALIPDRTVWKFTIQPGVENADNPGVLIDGKNTDVAVNSGVFWIQVDLTKTTTVTGVRTGSFGSSYAPRRIELATSDNGSDWVSHGELATSGTTQTTKFLAPVTCRYIKYNIITGSSNGRLDITEFNVFAK